MELFNNKPRPRHLCPLPALLPTSLQFCGPVPFSEVSLNVKVPQISVPDSFGRPESRRTPSQVPGPLPPPSLSHLPLRGDWDSDAGVPAPRVMSGQISTPKLAGLLGGLCGGGGSGGEGVFPFSEQLYYTVRGLGKNSLPLHSPASALALSLLHSQWGIIGSLVLPLRWVFIVVFW